MKRTILIIICLTGLVLSQQEGTKVTSKTSPSKLKVKYSNTNETRKIKIKPLFKEIQNSYNYYIWLARQWIRNQQKSIKLFPIKINGKYGYIDKNRKIVIKPQFDEADKFVDDLAKVKIEGKYGYIDKKGNIVLITNPYSLLPVWQEKEESIELFPIIKDGKWGYINKNGRVVIKPQYDNAEKFFDGLAKIRINVKNSWDSKCGYIDNKGKLVITPQFFYARNFSEGLARVEIGVNRVLDDVIQISKDHKCCFLDRTGRFIIEIPGRDNSAESFSEGLTVVRINRKSGYIDKKGIIVIKPQFNWAWNFSEGLAAVANGKKIGYIDKTGKIVIKPQFFKANNFSEGLARVQLIKNGKFVYIKKTNKTYKIAINPQFDNASDFSEGLARVAIDNKNGYIDTTGKIVIQLQFDGAGDFSEGLAAVKVNGKFGFIDKTGKIVINPQFDRIDNFSDGLARVWIKVDTGRKWGYIDKTGKYVWMLKGNEKPKPVLIDYVR